MFKTPEADPHLYFYPRPHFQGGAFGFVAVCHSHLKKHNITGLKRPLSDAQIVERQLPLGKSFV